ncbi:hypothetical protein O3M35_010447 [Rhynocoris fuscipes]|uniref:Tafazzin family protein n=1 Tax=Rhynocoris fuscipes TaxID=488301 RepID=A0AAW1D224_9HEMI
MESITIDWIFPLLRKPKCGQLLWNFSSLITISAVGTISKVIINWLNVSRIHNLTYFNESFENRPQRIPLITVSNHYSCVDDPAIWGCLKMKHICDIERMRWSLAAHDICFTNKLYSYFFMLGKCIPIIRGKGIYQEAMDFCLERLKNGDWMHIFPEGKVNKTKEIMRLKWGVGRLIYDAPITPIVIPIWHIGLDEVLPNTPPYILKTGRKLTFNFGKPINLTNLINELRSNNINGHTAYEIITDRIQIELLNLKFNTEALHKLYHSI